MPAAKKNAPMSVADVEAMRKLGRIFTPQSVSEKNALLDRMARQSIDDAETLIAWHDALLFWLAYPHTPELRARCEALLDEVAVRTRAMVENAPDGDMPEALIGSGLAWTRTAVTFNYPVSCWLAERFPEQARLHALRGDLDELRQALGNALPGIEFETVAEPADNARELVATLGGDRDGNPLRWLLRTLGDLPCSETMRRQIHRRLKIFVAIHSGDSPLSRTRLRGAAPEIHYQQTPLQRSEDVRAILDEPLPAMLALKAAERRQLLTAARGVLALLGRQTEPISDCDGEGVTAYALGRGVVIALFSAAPEHRPPLDSHVGMMLFKNGMPIAYGGGWPFLGVCKIGINIFEPYRGGESHFLFLSVMRAYRHLFGVNRFIVERYQFGRNNPEGIASGAYWFYYRLGFRSMSQQLAELAEREWAKLQATPGSSTDRDTLLAFTAVHMEMRLPGCPEGYSYCDPADLSRAVSRAIRERFAGNRRRFMSWAENRVREALAWPADDDSPTVRAAMQDLAPVLALIPDLASWPAAELKQCRQWVEAKAGRSELRYFAILHRHARLRAALEQVGAG